MTTTKMFELAEGGYSCALRRGGWMQTAITDLEERRDPRAKFERRCNEAFVALEKNDACQGRGDDHDDDDHNDDGIVDPNAFYLDGPDACYYS
jgi:hypothetical protein